jgi:hypothetical protein
VPSLNLDANRRDRVRAEHCKCKPQEAELRSYSNTPIGLNFLIAGYGYSEGRIAFHLDLAIANAEFFSNTEALKPCSRIWAASIAACRSRLLLRLHG